MSNRPDETWLAQLRHDHDHGAAVRSHEQKTRWVVGLTFVMMLVELVVGYATNSMALTADGWHMATHVGALGLSAFAYWFARRRSGHEAFSFGTGKVHALAGYTSAIVLALVALWMMVESLRRFVRPEPIAFAEALPVAVLGLLVNLASVRILHSADHDHDHEHDGDHDHDDERSPTTHDHHGHDHNLRAAYLHVLADALTSVLAILALLGGRLLDWNFLDAAMGVIGGLVIARWSYGLSRGAAAQLLDVVPSRDLAAAVRHGLEARFADVRVVDLHVWAIGPRATACIVAVAATSPRPVAAYREALATIATFDHVTIELHQPPGTRPGA